MIYTPALILVEVNAGVVERETVVELVKGFSPLLSAIDLGLSTLAFIVSFHCRHTIVSPCIVLAVKV